MYKCDCISEKLFHSRTQKIIIPRRLDTKDIYLGGSRPTGKLGGITAGITDNFEGEGHLNDNLISEIAGKLRPADFRDAIVLKLCSNNVNVTTY